MTRKKRPEEHENLERWLVSYADFMTLLFATFVVLYALAQMDIKDFSKLEESIKAAFNNISANTGQNIMDGLGENIIGKGGMPDNNSVIPPMMEYLSQKYENMSMESIKNEINNPSQKMEGISATMTERGLVITLKDLHLFFKSGSAQLTPQAMEALSKIGEMIKKKFNKHLIRVEGHTDNVALGSDSIYPSNWELSSARSAVVARFLISKFSIEPELFTVIGYGDTKPLESNSTEQGRAKNRRIEIVLLKNNVAKYEPNGDEIISPNNNTLSKQKYKNSNEQSISDAAQELLGDDAENKSDDVIVLDEYNKSENMKIKKAIKDFESNKAEGKNKFTSKLLKKN